MAMEELESYKEDIETARRELPDLEILTGAECEWTKEYAAFFREELLGRHRFDYLIGAIHWFPHHGDWISLGETDGSGMLASYADHLVSTMESGLFAFIAHPDGFGAGYRSWDENARSCTRDILQAAEALGVPLEINGYGFRKKAVVSTDAGMRRPYPLDRFWEMAADTKVKAVCNSDAHNPSDVLASIDLAQKLAEDFSISVIDPFEGFSAP
jgi:histidinol-phosphatase (PHP family)